MPKYNDKGEEEQNLFLQFQQHSTDFLRLLGEKSRAAAGNKKIAEELATMEFFWDGTEAIFKLYEERLQKIFLKGIMQHVNEGLMRDELKEVYNLLYQEGVNSEKTMEVFKTCMARTRIPSKQEIDQLAKEDFISKKPDQEWQKK